MQPDMTYFRYALGIANIIISVFILVFAITFLRKTEPQTGRKPWIFLLFAVMVFFIFEALNVFGFYSINIIPEFKDFLKTIFVALVLYVFVYQHYLITKSKSILIKRKTEPKIKKKHS